MPFSQTSFRGGVQQCVLTLALRTTCEYPSANCEATKVKPTDCGLCYHQVEDEPVAQNPFGMQITRKHHLYWRGLDSPAKGEVASGDGTNRKVIADHLANALTAHLWNTDYMGITWIMRWVGGKGLQPVRPIVVLRYQVQVDPETFIGL